MRWTPIQLALSTVVLALAIVAVFFRLDTPRAPSPQSVPGAGPGSDFCVGFEHPGIPRALVCATGPQAVITEAVSKVGLPEPCSTVPPPADLSPGDLIVFSAGDGPCRIERIGRLNGAHRLLCGVGIDVNLDRAESLMVLPGIGEVRARAIVEDRNANGPFESPADLQRVQGIGAKTVERLAPFLQWPQQPL